MDQTSDKYKKCMIIDVQNNNKLVSILIHMMIIPIRAYFNPENCTALRKKQAATPFYSCGVQYVGYVAGFARIITLTNR